MERAKTTEELDGDDETFTVVGDVFVYGLVTNGKAYTAQGRGLKRYFRLV
jgi:hypothetical protein